MPTIEDLELRIIELESIVANMNESNQNTENKINNLNKFINKFSQINNLVVRKSESGRIALRDLGE